MGTKTEKNIESSGGLTLDIVLAVYFFLLLLNCICVLVTVSYVFSESSFRIFNGKKFINILDVLIHRFDISNTLPCVTPLIQFSSMLCIS